MISVSGIQMTEGLGLGSGFGSQGRDLGLRIQGFGPYCLGFGLSAQV